MKKIALYITSFGLVVCIFTCMIAAMHHASKLNDAKLEISEKILLAAGDAVADKFDMFKGDVLTSAEVERIFRNMGQRGGFQLCKEVLAQIRNRAIGRAGNNDKVQKDLNEILMGYEQNLFRLWTTGEALSPGYYRQV